MYEYSLAGDLAGGRTLREAARTAKFYERGWEPAHLTTYETAGAQNLFRIAVGSGNGQRVEVRLYGLQASAAGCTLELIQTFSLIDIDAVKSISFCPAGEKVIVVTNGSRALVWQIGVGEVTSPIKIQIPEHVRAPLPLQTQYRYVCSTNA
jgi:hypothetical protein